MTVEVNTTSNSVVTVEASTQPEVELTSPTNSTVEGSGTQSDVHVLGQGCRLEFLPTPDRLDETNLTYFYFGWLNLNGVWLVRRQQRATSVTEESSQGYESLDLAWPNRQSLSYS